MTTKREMLVRLRLLKAGISKANIDEAVSVTMGRGGCLGPIKKKPLALAADSLLKASTPEPMGKKPLWGHKGLHLPAYIQHIANDIHLERGKTKSHAIAIAVNAVKRWASGRGHVDAGTRAAALKALAEWEALKAVVVNKPGGGRVSRALHASSTSSVEQPASVFSARPTSEETTMDAAVLELRAQRSLGRARALRTLARAKSRNRERVRNGLPARVGGKTVQPDAFRQWAKKKNSKRKNYMAGTVNATQPQGRTLNLTSVMTTDMAKRMRNLTPAQRKVLITMMAERRAKK